MKFCRKPDSVPFKKSLALERATIDGRKGYRTPDLGDQVWSTLQYFQEALPRARIIDPSYSNNTVSEENKSAIKQIAGITLVAKTWQEVI